MIGWLLVAQEKVFPGQLYLMNRFIQRDVRNAAVTRIHGLKAEHRDRSGLTRTKTYQQKVLNMIVIAFDLDTSRRTRLPYISEQEMVYINRFKIAR